MSTENHKATAESDKYYKALIETHPDLICRFNTSGHILFANAASNRLLGYAPDWLNSKNLTDICHPNEIPELQKLLSNPEKETSETKHRLLKKEGEFAWFRTLTTYDINPNGQIEEIQFSSRPVYLGANKGQSELAASELEKKNKLMEEFSRVLSHNMRAPINNLVTLADMLDLATDDDERNLMVTKMKKAGKNITDTFSEFLEVLRSQGGSHALGKELHLNQIVEEVLTGFEGEILEKGAIIEWDFGDAPTVRYPKMVVTSILQNLLSNSLKYRSTERVPKVEIQSFIHNDRTVLTFSDNGLGMDLLAHGNDVFGFHKTFHHHPDAKGVGLFITKNQVESLGGTITVTSELNVGTTFRIAF